MNDAQTPAHNQVDALRARIEALGPNAIAEIAHSAQTSREQVAEFRNGLPIRDLETMAALAAAVSVVEARVNGGATGAAPRASGPKTASTTPRPARGSAHKAPEAKETVIGAREAPNPASTTHEAPEGRDEAPEAPVTSGEAPATDSETPEVLASTGPDANMPPEPGRAMTTMTWFKAGLGPYLVSVIPPGVALSRTTKVKPEARGKVPGAPTPAGWVGVDLNDPNHRCNDLTTAKLWTQWSANAGLCAGDGIVVMDNDQGRVLGQIIEKACRKVVPGIVLLRRFVDSPSHERDAFLFRVLDFAGDPVEIRNETFKFECAGAEAQLQVLAKGKQLVVAGTHPKAHALYVLSRWVTAINDIPCLSVEQFHQILDIVIAEMKTGGWDLKQLFKTWPFTLEDSAKAGIETPSDAYFEEVEWILKRLPNRDVKSSEETDWDKFISNYNEWIAVLYALFGALGGAPKVTALVLGWSNNRAQPGQTTESAWKSVVDGGKSRRGIHYLSELARHFIGSEYRTRWTARQFPDLPPEEQAEYEQAEKEAKEQAEKKKAGSIEPVDLWPGKGTPVLPLGLLPKAIEKFAIGAARTIGADVGGFAMGALTAAAGAIPDAIKLNPMSHTDWIESARIWVALVGPPSTMKTPIINAVIAALKQKDFQQYRNYVAKKAFWDTEPKATRGPAPVQKRFIVNDTTLEAVQEILKTEINGLLGVYDELGGLFGQMDRYGNNGHGASERSFYLQAYNGGQSWVDRIGRGSFLLPNLSLSILGGVQPDVIRGVSNSANDDGLIQRLLPIMLLPGEEPVDDPQATADMGDFYKLIPKLLALRAAVPLRFDAGAQKIRAELETEHKHLTRVYEGLNRKLASAFGKQTGVFTRLCVVWHCVENTNQDVLPGIVTEDTARRVAAFLREFIRPHLVDFYWGVLELPEDHERLLSVAGYILAHKPTTLTNRDVQAAVRSMRNLTSKNVTPVMEQLDAFGWLDRSEQLRAGAPPVWHVNPKAHTLFAARAVLETIRREEARKAIAANVAVRRR